MDSIEDTILLDMILETCDTSENAICFIHDTIFEHWMLVVDNVCKPSTKQFSVLQMILKVIATKLAKKTCTCSDCCPKLQAILSVVYEKSRLITVVTETTISLQNFQLNNDSLLKWFTNLHLFCELLFKTFPMTICDELTKLIGPCLDSMKKIPGFQSKNRSIVTKYVAFQNKLRSHLIPSADKQILSCNERWENNEGNWDEMEPPENFRYISIIPTLEELTREENVFLRPNKTSGSYNNLEHYLDVQFRLLREDFVRPLRRAIQDFIKTRKDDGTASGSNPYTPAANHLEKTSVRVYKDVVFHRRENVTVDNSTHFIFELPRMPWRKVNWNKSKRLLPGSLVMLTADLCQTAIFAVTVAPPFDPKKAREEGNLNQTRKEIAKGILRLQVESGNRHVLAEKKYLMYECEAFFEAYRHNLAILQSMQIWPEADSNCQSLSKYIVEACPKVDYPLYLTSKEIRNYKFSIENANATCVDPLDPESWPNEIIQQEMGLDADQYAALKTALTSELAIIQGPPGTGKTFVGLQIVKTLLHNKKYSKISKAPFLILCYTNHALDQFLELLLNQFKDLKLVRVGGQTKSDLVQDHTLYEHRKKLKALSREPEDSIMCCDKHLYQYSKHAHSQVRKEGNANRSMRYFEMEHQRVGSEIEQLSNPNGIFDFNEISVAKQLCKIIGMQLWELMRNENWLGIQQSDFATQDFDVRQVLTRLFDLKPETLEKFANNSEVTANSHLKRETDELVKHGQQVDNSEYDLKELLEHRLVEEDSHLERRQQFIDSKKEIHENGNRAKIFEAVFNIYDECNLNLPDINEKFCKPAMHKGENRFEFGNVLAYPTSVRWSIYFKVLEIALDLSIKHRDKVAKQLANARKAFSDQRQMLDGSILQNCDIIGMTTTGAAKMHALLEIAKPEIVIVEEAAEILEAHIVTALTEHCKHLVLIGDHLQLRPSANVYELWSKYKLNVSLFERMILNGVPLCTLKTQHRMRPAIADLIVGPIYKELYNHPKVHNYPSVKGVNTSLFFVVHRQHEDTDMEIMSKTNFHEAFFLVDLCDYLLKHNYQAHQITILTTYTGQMFVLKKIIQDRESPSCKNVRVTSVDNYQGEENDIILLSLVRSNATNNVGFVGMDNRICVALSRARHGLFIIGNMSCMKHASKTWKLINQKLQQGGNIGPALPLKCDRHSNITYVRTGEDFKYLPSGGCTKLCAAKLLCGHLCPFLCHVQNPNHVNIKCTQRCRKYCKFKHQCFSPCYVKCPPCQAFVVRKLSCKHEVQLQCHQDPKMAKCMVKVVRGVPCKFNHKVEMECFQDLENFQCPTLVQKLLKCGHVQTVQCGLPLDQVKCSTYVDKELKCGHTVKMICSREEQDVWCNVKLKKELRCGHHKTVKCSTYVHSAICYENVDIIMFQCLHSQNIPCHSQSSHKCQAKCERVLKCGHLCRLTCHEDKDPNHLEYKCRETCERSCEYGHSCKYNHACFQKCYPCGAKVTVSLICGHDRSWLRT